MADVMYCSPLSSVIIVYLLYFTLLTYYFAHSYATILKHYAHTTHYYDYFYLW